MILEHLASGRLVHVRPRHQVGRSSGSALRIDNRVVSGAHAALAWTLRGWTIRDLGSRNGTWVGSDRLAPGVEVALSSGAQIAFGNPDDPWRVVNTDPPTGFAVALDTGEVVQFGDGLLALPDDDAPRLVVAPGGTGAWIAEDRDGERPVHEGEVLVVDGRPWRLSLPVASSETVAREVPIQLRLEVSRDEEHVRLTVLGLHPPWTAPSRTHHYLLVVLARQRSADLELGTLPDAEVGWIAQEDLLKQLGISLNALYQQVHRCRRELVGAGVGSDVPIVQRRRDAGQLRLALPAQVCSLE